MKNFLDIGAFVVSLIALAASIYYARDTSRISQESTRIAAESAKISAEATADAKKHNELSTRPLLDFQAKLSIGASEDDGGYIKVVNLGAGPAVITKIEATFDGKSIETSALELAKIGSQLGFIASTLRVNQVIAPGGEVNIYRIKPAQMAPSEICQRDKARKAFAEKLRFTLEYESLYKTLQSAEFSYKSANHLC